MLDSRSPSSTSNFILPHCAQASIPSKSEDMIVPSTKAREWEEAPFTLGDGNSTFFQEPNFELWNDHNQSCRSPVGSMNTQSEPDISVQIPKGSEPTILHPKTAGNDEDGGVLSDDLNVRDTDIVISLVGPTGVGKSTFINAALGKELASVGHTLDAQTTEIQDFVLRHPKDPNRRIVLVDTPGYNDVQDNADDRDTLRRIGDWLSRRYGAKKKLSGIIYLLEITQARFKVAPHKNIDLVRKLCGDRSLRNVVLASTKWTDTPQNLGERREQQLGSIWGPLLDEGSTMYRFTDTRESAMKIITQIIANTDKMNVIRTANFMEEVIKIDKILAQTEAGRALPYTLRELVETHLAAMSGTTGGDVESLDPSEDTIHVLINQIKSLNVQLARSVRYFLGL